MSKRQTMCRGKDAGGFTLVELLVVVSIIAILLAVIVPSISSVRILAQSASSQSMVRTLDQNCQLFYNDHKYYPGASADPNEQMRLDPNNPLYLEASQILTRDLFGFTALRVPEAACDPNQWTAQMNAKRYAELEPSDLDLEGKKNDLYYNIRNDSPTIASGGTRRPYLILDRFGESRPILYFPARQPPRDINESYLYGARPANAELLIANSEEAVDIKLDPEYVAPDENEWARFRRFAGNPTSAGLPAKLEVPHAVWVDPNNIDKKAYRNDTFLLIGAGIDGKYLTEDDTTNFPNNVAMGMTTP